jgi:hypothetical protein
MGLFQSKTPRRPQEGVMPLVMGARMAARGTTIIVVRM